MQNEEVPVQPYKGSNTQQYTHPRIGRAIYTYAFNIVDRSVTRFCVSWCFALQDKINTIPSAMTDCSTCSVAHTPHKNFHGWNVSPVRPVRSEVSATPRTGLDAQTGWSHPVSGESENLSGGQSQVSDGQPSRTSRTDSGRVRNVTKFLVFLDGRGQNTS